MACNWHHVPQLATGYWAGLCFFLSDQTFFISKSKEEFLPIVDIFLTCLVKRVLQNDQTIGKPRPEYLPTQADMPATCLYMFITKVNAFMGYRNPKLYIVWLKFMLIVHNLFFSPGFYIHGYFVKSIPSACLKLVGSQPDLIISSIDSNPKVDE